MPTKNEPARSRVILATTNIPTGYHADRLNWWTINSPAWSKHIDADGNRTALLVRLAERARSLTGSIEQPRVADFGCGEGAFLRALKRLVPAAALTGIDFCPTMLAEAGRRSSNLELTYTLGDLEQSDFAPTPNVDLVTSILAMDEMDQLELAFGNIAKALVPGGVAMLVVMDPLKEIERNRKDLEAHLNGNVRPDDAVLLVKTFPTANMEPAAPYSRIVRPIAHYNAAAIASGLRPEGVEQWTHTVGIGSYSGTLLFDVLTFRNSGATG
jgi:ubiquinone/menaquinone biosynthesis C-methylase UbiE